MKLKKVVTLAASVILVAAFAVSGTLAYLTDSTKDVKNTFTVGKVCIDLQETVDGKLQSAKTQNIGEQYKLIPGSCYCKDPRVTVKANSEECYLFVNYQDLNNSLAGGKHYVNYTSLLKTPDWKQLTGHSDIWYRVVSGKTSDQTFQLIKDNKIAIDPLTVTNETINDAVKAQIIYTAYAIQKANVPAPSATATEDEMAVAAWTQIGA
jgi:predicted ribosomally synthesized peptide with SipW-like signal peptide